MFVPSIEALSNKLNFDRSSLDQDGTVRVPTAMLKFLLQIALTAVEFDEGAYLKENPDVAEAVERGEIASAYMHYIGYGYFEGRSGGGPEVEEDWYLQKKSRCGERHSQRPDQLRFAPLSSGRCGGRT
jgi:hypothetical protein